MVLAVTGVLIPAACSPAADRAQGTTASPTAVATEDSKQGVPQNTEPLPPDAPGPVPRGFGTWADVFQLQARMDAAADRISGAAGADVGLAGIVVAPETRRLTVYWKGDPPAETMRLVDAIRDSLPVDIQDARYSLNELSEVSNMVITKPGVVSVGGNVDGSGITATVDAEVNVADWGVHVPVSLVRGKRPSLTNCSRHDDCTPWWAGGAFKSSIGKCTTGFAVRKSATAYMLSAAHCANIGGSLTDPKGSKIGTVFADDNARDTMLVQHTSNTNFSGTMYTGPWNADATNFEFVKGSYGSYIGNFVCTSGSYTGWHCFMKVTAVWQWVTFDDGTTNGPLVIAGRLDGGVSNGKGDSGGPVYAPTWFDAAGQFAKIPGVYAKGTITGGNTEVACPAGSPSPRALASSFTLISNWLSPTTQPRS